MALNPLAPVTDYQSMLNRIFWFTTASALAGVALLRLNVPEVEALMSRVDFLVTLGGGKPLPAPAGTLLPALAIGVAARIFRLHGRISDWLGIRECFDIDVILREFAKQLGIDLAPLGDRGLRKARHALMRKAFYPYVSGPQSAVDQQLVHQALDSWSWLWAAVESTAVGALAAMGVLAGGATAAGLQLLTGAVLLGAIGVPALRAQCRRFGIAQVRTILADAARTREVRKAFAEHGVEAPAIRLAA